MKKQYKEPELNIVKLEKDDVIITSFAKGQIWENTNIEGIDNLFN